MTFDVRTSAPATPLPTRVIGGEPVGAIGLGCMGMSDFYGPADEAASRAVLEEALDRGVTMLDTADMYGRGANEELLADVLRRRRAEAFVATKFGIVRGDPAPGYTQERRSHDGSPAYVRAACDASLRRLGVDAIDLYYLHRVDPATPVEETVAAMADLVRAGKVRHLGLSEVSAAQLRAAHGVHPIAAVQSELSLWTRDHVANGVLAAARELGVATVAYAPLGRGMLTGALRDLAALAPDDFRRAAPRFAPGNLEANLALVERVEELAAVRRVTPAQLALAWVLALGEDVIPIVGTTKVAHLRSNLEALAVAPALSADEIGALDALFAGDAVRGARYPGSRQPQIENADVSAGSLSSPRQ